jgi:hypothetical protein
MWGYLDWLWALLSYLRMPPHLRDNYQALGALARGELVQLLDREAQRANEQSAMKAALDACRLQHAEDLKRIIALEAQNADQQQQLNDLKGVVNGKGDRRAAVQGAAADAGPAT